MLDVHHQHQRAHVRRGHRPVLLEGFANAADHAALGRCHRVAPQLGQPPVELLLFVGQIGGRAHDVADAQVAPAPAPDVGHAVAPEPDDFAALGARGDAEVLGAVEGLEPEVGAQGGLG